MPPFARWPLSLLRLAGVHFSFYFSAGMIVLTMAASEFAAFCPLASVLRLAGVHFLFCFSAGMVVSTVAARNLSPFARWPLPFFASPACIFYSISPPAWLFRRWRRGICLLLPAGRCRSSLCRRAFFILFLRRHGRFDDGGEEFASFCPLAAVVARLAGVHFSFYFSAGMIVLTMAVRNLPPFARWPLAFFASPACIFYSVSPPAWLFRRWRRGICLLLPAGRCRCSPRRRAFFILFLRRRDRFDDGGEEFASFCPLAAGFLRLAGVHFLSRFSAGPGVSTLPACIFHPVSPPTWSFRRCRGGICLLLHAGRYRSSPCRRAFLILFLRRRDCFDDSGEEFASFCTLAAAVLRFAGVHFLFCFSAGMVVSTVAWRNLPPFARWPLPFFALPACIFHSISPPVWSFRRCRGRTLPPFARWPLALLASPACIFYSVSPPAWLFRRWRRGICSPFARWPLPFFASPACIFYSISPPA